MADNTSRQTALSRLVDFEAIMCRRRGRSRPERYRFAIAYFAGENLPPENVEQPLAINYVRMLCEKGNHFLFGQWSQYIIRWRVTPKDDSDAESKKAKKIEDWIYQLCRENNANEQFWEAGLNGAIFGDSVFRVTWDILEQRVRWQSMLPENCHFRWRINDLTDVLELIISYKIPRSEALAEYGTQGNVPASVRGQDPNDPLLTQATYWEYWTPWLYQTWVDDVNITNKPNPLVSRDPSGNLLPGIINYVHIPNIRAAGEFYGYNDVDGILNLQDELNRKMADSGDIINNFAHPITIVNKFYGEDEELPVGPDQIWNLGREGEASYLTWDGTAPGVQEYINTVIEMMMDTASMSLVAFGRHKGTQQSAIALAIEMMPVTDRVRWKRMHWEQGLHKLLHMTALVTERNQGTLPVPYQELLTYEIEPLWAPVLPRDRMADVNENVTMVVNHLRSIKKALNNLDEKEIDQEHDAIFDDLAQLAKLGVIIQGLPGGQGSSSLPEGGNDAKNKGRPPK